MLKKILDRPVAVTMTLLAIMVLGLVGARKLPVSLIPDVDIPHITVQANNHNLSAREIDETVSRPLRQQLIQIDALEDMESKSVDGSCTINLSFRQGTDMDYAFIEVNEKIDRTMGGLKNIERPKAFKNKGTDIPAFYINMTLKEDNSASEETPVSKEFSSMSRFASEVAVKRIEQLDEVAMVDLSGIVEPEILVVPDMEKLRALGITESRFEALVRTSNISLGSLSIKDGEYRYDVKFQSLAADKESIENIYLSSNGKLLQIKDIARVIEHPSKRLGLVRSDGKNAITMAVIKQSDARMADLKKSVNDLINLFRSDYPDIEFIVTRDQTELLEYSINNLIKNIISGIILACLVIFLFMKDFRSSALVALTIPVSIVFSMLIFYAIGLTINIISLSGLVLGVGMIVDNTIILTDNITARWQRGESLRRAVIKGTYEVTGPMLSSVITTCAVFIPLIFLSGVAGAIFYDQAMAVTIVLLTSYVVTITVIPVYYWHWYRKKEAFRPNAFLEKFSFDKVVLAYESGELWLLRHRWLMWAVFAFSSIGLVLCFALMPKEKLPEITYTDTVLKIDWNAHVSLEENEKRTAEVEKIANEYALHTTSMVGVQKFVLGHSGELSASEVFIYFKCNDAESLDKMTKSVSSFLRKEYPSCLYGFKASGNIFDMVFASDEADIVARLRPVSSAEIETSALSEIAEKLSEEFPQAGIQKIPMKKEIIYVADPEKMALYNVSYQDISAVLKNALNENFLFNIVQGNITLPVVMGVDNQDISTIINGSSVKKEGYEIPLNSIMTQTFQSGLKYIISGGEGNYYPVEMEFSGINPSGLMDKVREVAYEDGNFEVSFSGSWFSNRKITKELLIVLVIAVLLLYLILASQFESLVQPLIILSEIIIDIFGALALLWLFGVSINLMSLIGLVVICGIVINDSILKIDTMNRLRKEGMPLRRAVLEAGHRRIKAIVMTSLTTIFSVCPFLVRGSMGDDLHYPMSLVIIAGMAIGTLVSLFFIPMVYYEIYRRQEDGK